MAVSGGQDQSRSHVEETDPEKQGFLSKVKDSLNLTKHFGFVSDVDSPANQAALAAVREKEEREGVAEEVPQPPLSERIVQGVNSVAQTATEIGTGTSGGVHPRSQASPEQAESFNADTLPGETVGHPGVDGSPAGDGKHELSGGLVSKESEHQQELSNGMASQDSEHSKHSKSWAPWSGHKETDPKPEKEGSSFSKWAVQAAHKLGDAVASKDLSENLSSKKKGNKT